VHRALQLGAGLALAFAILTCTNERVTGPTRPGALLLDVHALVASSPGQPVIPLDSLRITLRRPTETTYAYDKTVLVRSDTVKGDSVVLRLDVQLQQSAEDFILDVTAFGAGIAWYSLTASVHLTAGATAAPTPFLARYIGPGHNAKLVRVFPVDTTAIGGTSFPLRSVVTDSSDGVITGVPVGYRLSDATHGSVTTGYLSASFTAAPTVRDSVWVFAETPTHLKDSTRIHILPPAASLQKVSGDAQTAVLGAPLKNPLVVRVLDALNGGFKGDTVRWTVTTANATLTAPFSVSDDTGFALVSLTPSALGSVTVQAAVTGLSGSPQTFTVTSTAGTVRQVIISPKLDTISRGLTVQYTAVAKDQSGNVVNTPFNWVSTAQTIATINPSGLATAVAGDSTLVIAGAGGYADTAKLYVRALRTVVVSPADTVVTAVNDSFPLTTSAKDNFGVVMTSGFTTHVISASPSVVVVNAATGRIKSVGAGNGVLVVRDSVDPQLVVQGSATVHVNQVTRTIYNRPGDSVAVGAAGQISIVLRGSDSAVVGVLGQTNIVAVALDSNGYRIPGKVFGWTSRNATLATVSSAGTVSGVRIGTVYVADSVDGLLDSTRVAVVTAPPKQISWGLDSVPVGNGGNISIAITVSQPPSAPLTISIASSDSTIAKAAPNTVVIAGGASATSAVVYGLRAGRAVLTASDASGGYASRAMIVGVVSTISFREIASPCCQQQYFYLNQNETHKAQVWLSDPAPPGAPLGITFISGKGLAAVTPSPAIIPAGQLSADIIFQGLKPGVAGQPDSVVPSQGSYVGKFSYVYVAPDSLRLSLPSPYNGVLGVGQTFQPYVSFTYGMDHPLGTTAALSPMIGTVQSPDTIPTNTNFRYFQVGATALGTTTLTVGATGWVGVSVPLTFSTPYLGASGTFSMVAGDPNKGYWSATAEDSLRYGHAVTDTLVVTAVSRNPNAVVVDSPTVKVLPGNAAATSYNSLRALATAGGDSSRIVITAPAPYKSDSFMVHVTKPVLSLYLSSPYDGRVGLGTLFQNAGYVSIPYVRPDTFTVVLAHARAGIVGGGPVAVSIPKGQTYAYFNIRGDTLGTDTVKVDTVATKGYVVQGSPVVFTVDPIHVRASSYPSTLYTISRPQLINAYVVDSVNGQARPLLAKRLVSVTSTNPRTFTLDSAQVPIDSGQAYSRYDTLRVVPGADTTAGAYVRFTAPGSSPDSTPLIRVVATPLSMNVPYPYNGQVGRGLRLRGYTVSIPDLAPDTVRVVVKRYSPLKDSLSADTVKIAKSVSYSQSFDVFGFDSTGTDSITASATGFVTARTTITDVPAALNTARLGANHLTTEPPFAVSVYTRTRAGYQQSPTSPVTFSIKSTDSSVIQIDSANAGFTVGTGAATIPANLSYGYYRIRYVGNGQARIRVSAVGFDSDSTELVTVTGPSLYFGSTTVTVGTSQIFTGQYVYVNNVVTGSPLVVHLTRSDSLPGTPTSAQVFGLSADSVIIPVSSSSSSAVEITGKNVGAVFLIARAPGYSQATATVSVGQPRLIASSKTLSLYVGAPATNVAVYTQDQASNYRIVAAPTAVGAAVSAPTIVSTDSASKTIAARIGSTSFGLAGLQKGSAAVVFSSSALGYKPDTTQVSVDTAMLVLNSQANGLGPGQVGQMYVSIPFNAVAPVTVNLASSATNTLTVPSTVTIPANNSSVYFTVTGVAQGTATISASATGFYAATPVGVTVGQPKVGITFPNSMSAGVPYPIYVYAQDANGTTRNVAAPLTITLTSSSPSHTIFGSASVTIPAGSSSASTNITFDTAGVYTISASASGYTPASVTSTTTGALVRMIAPTSFSPASVTIKAGQNVTWRNDDATAAHTTTENSATPVWNSGPLALGQSYVLYFSTAGTYSYHCTIHGAAVMSGTVTVTP
jgi:plastocyanin